MKPCRFLVFAATLLVPACTDRSPTTPTTEGARPEALHLGNGAENLPRFVYAANDFYDLGGGVLGGDVSGYAIQADGSLTTLPGPPFRSGSMNGCVAVATDPTGHQLYVVCDLSLDVTAFDIAPDGSLSAIQRVPVGDQYREILVTPAGQFLYVAAGRILGYAIQPDGSLVELAGSPFTSPNLCCSARGAIDPQGRYLYFPARDRDLVVAFAIQADGSLLETGTVPSGGAPTAIAIHPTGAFAYVANQLSSDITEYRVDPATEGWQPIGTVRTDRQPRDLKIEPTGKFLYVANQGANTITAYRIDASTGLLTRSKKALRVSGGPFGLAIDPSGHFLYSANNSHDVASFAIDLATGNLTAAGPRVPAGDPWEVVAIARPQ